MQNETSLQSTATIPGVPSANRTSRRTMMPLVENDGQLLLMPCFLAAPEASALLDRLTQDLAWTEESIRIYGKTVRSPRLVCWYGHQGAIYTYSGIVHHPLPWHPLLTDLRIRLEETTGQNFNSVLCNFYRDGNDAMGWHADSEKELGPRPYLASLSIGETRVFRVHHIKTGTRHSINLENGDLIIMCGEFQRYWRHSVPRSKKTIQPRINLSFRRIQHQ
ncbi:MAG: alpha-ketoglutarate-dependent dioxygenase AlkB [Methylococcales bacterium]|nr:alpha-ketoglutarate-dependent dioxygenase AlkB [Methylococcales bacterium]